MSNEEELARKAELERTAGQDQAPSTDGLEDASGIKSEEAASGPTLQAKKEEARKSDEKRKKGVLSQLREIGQDFKRDFNLGEDRTAIKTLAAKVTSPVKKAWGQATEGLDMSKDRELLKRLPGKAKELPGKAKGAVRGKWQAIKGKLRNLLKE
ncbi:MAG TPA: hypothetical protein VJH63_01745 [Candidatus Paceibacterota bacterium]